MFCSDCFKTYLFKWKIHVICATRGSASIKVYLPMWHPVRFSNTLENRIFQLECIWLVFISPWPALVLITFWERCSGMVIATKHSLGNPLHDVIEEGWGRAIPKYDGAPSSIQSWPWAASWRLVWGASSGVYRFSNILLSLYHRAWWYDFTQSWSHRKCFRRQWLGFRAGSVMLRLHTVMMSSYMTSQRGWRHLEPENMGYSWFIQRVRCVSNRPPFDLR